ncbi:MAG: YkgJ family cysteine cluster protein [Chroococcidiopsidaceae cyanobacterium CP_BM_ER_R8_30]|nr:YkgJ family cysteine cluster protein [Chroococcidiopsidaceae cyanobacterium CP_BM_ER_R8_30]
MANWHCIRQCGACCHLDPTRYPALVEYLTLEELELYLSLIGEDGWCVKFNRITRTCSIYPDRPRFCRFEPGVFQDMYCLAPEDFNNFTTEICQQQISGVYGDFSLEMQNFNRAIVSESDEYKHVTLD